MLTTIPLSGRVVGLIFLLLRLVLLGNLAKKVQFGYWTSCFDGDTIVRFGSLLGCVKRTNVLLFAINLDPCSEPLPNLVHSFELDIVLRSVLLLSLSFWHCSFFPCDWCCRTLVLCDFFFRRLTACGEGCGVCDQELCHACRVSRPLLLVSLTS